MGLLVEGVQRHEAPAALDRLFQKPCPAAGVHQAPEDLGELAAHPFLLEELPLLEGRAVLESELRKKVAPVERRSRGESVRLRGRSCAAACCSEAAELLQVHVQPPPPDQGHIGAIGVEPLLPDEAAQERKRLAEVGARTLRGCLWEEQRRERLPPMRQRRDGEVREERHDLAPLESEGHSLKRDRGRPENEHR